MLKRKIAFVLQAATLTVFLILGNSCIKDVDFDQADNIELTPVLTSSVIYTEVEAGRFFENGLEILTVRDTISNIEIFKDEFVNDNLVMAELVFETTNSINRRFNLQIDFLNDADELQHSFSFDAQESPSGNNVITEYTEVFEDTSLEALKLSTQLIITLSLYPSPDGSMLNEDSEGEIALKSKGIFYFNINV